MATTYGSELEVLTTTTGFSLPSLEAHLEDSMEYYYPFTESSLSDGTTIVDSSTNSRDANSRNEAAASTGILDNQVTFDGSNDYIDIGDHDFLDQVTWGFIITGADQGAGKKAIFSKWGSSGQRSFTIASAGTSYTDKMTIRLTQDGSTVLKDYKTSVVVFDNTRKWIVIALDCKNNTLRIYINGEEDTSITKTTDSAINNIKSSTPAIGLGSETGDSYNNGFTGKLEQVWHASRCWTGTEAKLLYNSGVGLKLYND